LVLLDFYYHFLLCEATEYNTDIVVYMLSLITGIFSSLVSGVVQLDLKRVIAYSSISHMVLMLFLGCFSDDSVGFSGAFEFII